MCVSSRVSKYRIIPQIRKVKKKKKLLKNIGSRFLTLPQIECRKRGALLKIQMDVALFMYMFYARHAKKNKKTSGADTHFYTQPHARGGKHACL